MTSVFDWTQPPCATAPATGNIFVDATAPSAPKDGDLWFDLRTNEWKRFDAGVWVLVTGGGGAALPPPQGPDFLLLGDAAATNWRQSDTLFLGNF